MEEPTLPEEMIVLILTFHSLILSDPKFAQSQFRAARDRKAPNSRLLCSSCFKLRARFESIDLESPSFGDSSSVRELNSGLLSVLLGSCNGIVFLAFDYKIFYMRNPSTGFFKKLPDHPGFSPHLNELVAFGVGYLPATDDYRVLVVSHIIETKDEAAIF
ncbi:PREDICTED: uncharacterized protein LOC101302966 [Fragaria vesca subsp. vesca]